MMIAAIRKGIYLLISTVLLSNCVDKEKKSVTPGTDSLSLSRAAVLINLADEIVEPANANFKLKLDTMISFANKFTSKPDTSSLREFRAAWQQAYIAWQKVQVLDFGPAKNNATINYFNIFPANVASIEANIKSGNANLEIFGNYPTQGFPAFDYLLNGLASTDDSIVTYFTTDSLATKRIAYVNKLNDQMLLKINQVINEWTVYRSTFVNTTDVSASSSFSIFVNGFIEVYEKNLRLGKFGVPSGYFTKVIAPEKVEAFYKKDLSKMLAQTAIQATQDLFNGKSVKTGIEGKSLKTYLDDLSAKDSETKTNLSTSINNQFEVIKTSVNAMGDNFYTIVNNNNQQMLDTYAELQEIIRLLKVDMSSAISVTITYNDNDGD